MTRYILPLIIMLSALLAGCQDDLRYNPYGEGEAEIEATVKFQPLIGDNVGDPNSRSTGDAIHNIRNIQVIIYRANGTLVGIERFGEEAFTPGSQTAMPGDHQADDQSEASTATATFQLSQKLKFGSYKIYVVGNFRDISEDEVSGDGVWTGEQQLKNLKADWDEKDVRLNDQMFGFLTEDNTSETVDGDAPAVRIESNSVHLEGWIKRLASKITIVYDGRGLHDGINIYIKSISVRDIPRSCYLGFDSEQLTDDQKKYGVNGNSPTSKDQLIPEPVLGTLYYKTTYKSEDNETVDKVEVIGANLTPFADPNLPMEDWLHITNNVKYQGSVETTDDHQYKTVTLKDADGNDLVGDDGKVLVDIVMHTEDMQALYFYENCQGNYPSDMKQYDKTPFLNDVGKKEDNPDVYKDQVPYGTFVEVEGYYVSTNPNNQSQGPIKYRFMLGQNSTFNYNALRNRHYKLHLGFRGYANQPEWHIVYEEDKPGLYPKPKYDVSYLYNNRHDMPIRMTGRPYKVTLQIIENNWAPYDPTQPDSVAATPSNLSNTSTEFAWYRDIYFNQSGTNTVRPTRSFDGMEGFMYGRRLQERYSSSGRTRSTLTYATETTQYYDQENGPLVTYSPALNNYWNDNVQITPVWVGFLALQVPRDYENYDTSLPTGINDSQTNDNYRRYSTVKGMREYYTGKGGTDTNGNTNVGVTMYQCTYDFSDNPPAEGVVNDVASDQSVPGSAYSLKGRNAATIKNNGDGSYTLTAPLFTMPKSIGYITGFSGNNPYEAYEREAKVRITAYYKVKNDEGQDVDHIIVKNVPVYQQRRIVNPKGVWRSSDNYDSFHVKLMDKTDPNSSDFRQFDSDEEWTAWVADPNGNEDTPLTGGFVTIRGASGGVYKGATGSKIDFWLDFNKGNKDLVKCAKVIVKYHGSTCQHAIFVRQGYDRPLAIVDGGAMWSSFAVFAFNESTPLAAADGDNLPGDPISGLKAEMTVNPLALGTMFKRGNYNQGIRIINDKTWPVMVNLTNALQLISIDSDGNHVEGSANWGSILGIANTGTAVTLTEKQFDWKWSSFSGTSISLADDYEYDIPTYEDYADLADQDVGFGVLYADGANETLDISDSPDPDIPAAYGYFNDGNNEDMKTSQSGMRGVFIYNKKNYNQVFFPIGYSGVGRRTMQTVSEAQRGYLRYGAVDSPLYSSSANSVQQYRPITFHNNANPGVMYWFKKSENIPAGTVSAWDFNYFDLSSSAYDAATYGPYGDAIPIKPIVTKLPSQQTNKRKR